MKILSYLFRLNSNPKRGLLAAEWVMLAYMVVTLVLIFFTYTRLYNPESMLWGRVRILAMTMALWGVYRMLPCRFMLLARIILQMALLSWWYPDTYEFNRIFPNLDHIFATWEQQLFGFQPSLVFAATFPNAVVSELMDLGYACYYPLIALVVIYYFIWRYDDFGKASFIILAAFFIYYIVYIAVPVAGPQYYYKAVGLAEIARGHFPDIGHYFADHQEALTSPGYTDGFFYKMVAGAHDAGERPTAAFPSSHVGVTTILMFLALKTRSKRLIFGMLPLYVLLCLSTVYIYAHYAIDVLAGWVSAALLYGLLALGYNRWAK